MALGWPSLTQTKFAASSLLPDPFHLACCG
jgi:hypothetical protein